MDGLQQVWQWFSGGPNQYHDLWHCMRKDTVWVTITVALDLAVATGYMFIARHWLENQRALRNERARRALGRMKSIFLFCGLCGYIFIPIKMFWPAWRLYDCFLLVLAWITWRYALDTRHLKVVYNELNRSEDLAHDLEASRADARRKTYFLNAVSHDLRTPLNGLVLQVDYARLTLQSGNVEAAHQALAAATASAQAATDLLNSFMELARLDWAQENAKEDLFDVCELVRRVADQIRISAMRKGLAVTLAGTDRPLPVRTDALRLERVLLNLASNAVKFTDAGQVSLHVRREQKDVLIEVADTGIGISDEEQRRLFEDLFQAHNQARDRSKGFGLGLAIARRLVNQLGGELSVQSAPGRGSRFTVRLGGAVAEPEPAGARSPPTPSPGTGPAAPATGTL